MNTMMVIADGVYETDTVELIVSEYIYLKNKYNSIKSIIKHNNTIYQNDIIDLINDNNLDIPKPNLISSKNTVVKEKQDRELKNFYHLLLKLTHPDINKHFTELNKSIIKHRFNFMYLIHYANVLGIDFANYFTKDYLIKTFSTYKKEMNMMRDIINIETENLLYDYSENKEELLKIYLKQCL
jgi:hypothetical protein